MRFSRLWPAVSLVIGSLFLGLSLPAQDALPLNPADKPAPSAVKAPAPPNPYWERARLIVDHSVRERLAQALATPDFGLLSRQQLRRGDVTRKMIALTIDDGPHARFTPQLLAVLNKYHVKATFFLVGKMAEKYPDLVLEEVADGHAIGNHTYHHVDLTTIPAVDVATEIKACGEVIKHITGKAPHLFRPPGGDFDFQVTTASAELGYTTVLWSDDPGDYASPGIPVITTRTLDHATNGGIILLHDGVQQTVDALPTIIESLRARGYEFVTVDEMMNRK